jgi:hypothetical protein
MADKAVLAAGAKIRALLGEKGYHLVKIGPAAYNRLYAKIKNINRLLAWAHGTCIEGLLEKQPSCPRVVVDQFAPTEATILRALKERGRQIAIEQRHRAEDDIAVAAASVVAREAFLRALCDMAADVDPAAEIISDYWLADFSAAPTGETVSPGTYIYKNKLGGTVAVAGLKVDSIAYNTHGPKRKRYLLEVMKKLAPETIPVYADIDQKIYLRCGKRNDGGYLVGMVNLSFDTVDKITLATNFDVKGVSILNGEGIWEKLDWQQTAAGVAIDKNMICYETVVLKLDN